MAIVKYLDTYTDDDAVNIVDHDPDSHPGEPWQLGGSAALPTVIASNKASWTVSISASSGRRIISTAAVDFQEGDEIFADIELSQSDAAEKVRAALGFHQAADLSFSAYYFKAQWNGDDTVTLVMEDFDGGPSWGSAGDSSAWENAEGTNYGTHAAPGGQIRLGVTKGAGLNFTPWVEPYGGGTRTNFAEFTASSDRTADQLVVMAQHRTGSSPDVSVVTWDNFTVQTPDAPAPEQCFETTYDCAVAVAPTFTDVAPTVRVALDDSCIPEGTLEAYE